MRVISSTKEPTIPSHPLQEINGYNNKNLSLRPYSGETQAKLRCNRQTNMWEAGSSRNLDITFQECNSMIPYLPFLMGNQFDIQAYADKYPTRTKIIRLLALAHHCHGRNDDRELEALKIAYKEAKKGKDVQLFATVVEKINGRLSPEYDMDEDWCNEVIRNWEENRVRLGEEASKCQV